MAQSGVVAYPGVPQRWDVNVITASATGNINVGDWLFYTGQFVMAGISGTITGYWKASGAGVAMESNPLFDQAGRTIVNSALKVMTQGIFIGTAAFSGQPGNGVGAYPVATGSGVYYPTGATGVGATWQTADVGNHSALSGTATVPSPAVVTVIGSQNFSNAGTGELIMRLAILAPDVRG